VSAKVCLLIDRIKWVSPTGRRYPTVQFSQFIFWETKRRNTNPDSRRVVHPPRRERERVGGDGETSPPGPPPPAHASV
jgi:hypothetical protein